MATAGSIVVDLLLKTGSFVTDTDRAAKQFKKLQREAQQAGKVIGSAITVGASAAALALQLTINSMDDMSKAAQRVGASTEEFSKLTYAAGLADVEMSTLVGSLGKLLKAQSAALKETSEQSRVFDALGISIKNADGSLRESTDVLSDFADKFQALKGSPEAMAAGFSLFGRSFQELIPLLKDGGDGIRAAGDELEALGGVLSTEAGRNAEEFNDNITRLKTTMFALSQAVAADLLPDLIELSENMLELAKDGDSVADTANSIANVFRVLGGAAGFLGEYLKAADNIIQGLTRQFQAFLYVLNQVRQGNLDLAKTGFQEFVAGQRQVIVGDESPAARGQRNVRGGSNRTETGGANVFGTEERIRLALAGGAAKPKKKGGGKSDAEREAEQLEKAYESLRDNLNETNALFGKNTEAAKVLYETQSGGLAALSQPLKDELVMLAERNDAQKLSAELAEAAQDAAQKESDRIKDALKSNDMLIEDLQFEQVLMRMNNVDRERELALRALNVDATDEQREAVARLAEENERMREQIGVMDDLRSEFQGFFSDVLTGTKSVKDAFTDMLDNIQAMILDRIAQNWVDQLFGQQGTSNTGAAGAGGFDWGALVGAFFGGGKASGGDVMGKRSYLVGEQGPEMFIPRTAGVILPASQTAAMMGGGGGFKQTNIYQVQGRIDRRTRDDISSDNGRKSQNALRRNGR